MTCFGWTWDYIAENIDLIRLKSILDAQDTYPPLHQMVAAYLGIDSKKSNSNSNDNDESFEDDESFLYGMGVLEAPTEFNVRQI